MFTSFSTLYKSVLSLSRTRFFSVLNLSLLLVLPLQISLTASRAYANDSVLPTMKFFSSAVGPACALVRQINIKKNKETVTKRSFFME